MMYSSTMMHLTCSWFCSGRVKRMRPTCLITTRSVRSRSSRKIPGVLLNESRWKELLAKKQKAASMCKRCSATRGWLSPQFNPYSPACDRFGLPAVGFEHSLAYLAPLMHVAKGPALDNSLCRFCVSLMNQFDMHLFRFCPHLVLPAMLQVMLSITGKG